MMISPSSSQLGAAPTTVRLADSLGQPVKLGSPIGKGGEGIVYEVADEPALAAKIYHDAKLDPATAAKLQLMVQQGTPELRKVAAWPTSVLYEEETEAARGILMPRIDAARQLHELYGTTNRKRHFPGVLWHHMLLAARNTAAAFHAMHEAGVIVGDVNQGNLLVDDRMRVRFIDCDSFQIAGPDTVYTCPVGTPHFTPGELQSQNLREVERNVDHDAFGLAILIFHLVFVGRHPFAGRFRGEGDLPIERAIGERRFAFSRDRWVTQVDPPPASLSLDDLPGPLANLFEIAFRADLAAGDRRPEPAQWAEALDHLMSHRKVCQFDERHIHYNELDRCPWCRIEDEGGPTFFVRDAEASIISSQRLAELDRRVSELRVIQYPELPHGRLDLPPRLRRKELDTMPKVDGCDAAAAGMVVAAALALATPLLPPLWFAATALTFACGLYLLLGPKGRARRARVAKAEAELEKDELQLGKVGRLIESNYKKRRKAYQASVEALRTAAAHYRAEGEELKEVLKTHRSSHLEDFLRGYLVRDAVAVVPGLTPPVVSMLESFNVETARDVDQLSLSGIPNVDATIILEMIQWRAALERQFEFKPDHGVTEHLVDAAEKLATQRFKQVQARKVLMGSSQLDQMAQSAECELQYALKRFDQLADHTRALAHQLRDVESSRRNLERTVNSSPGMLITLMIAIPVVGGILWLALG